MVECTGQLIATGSHNYDPVFLTARHCFENKELVYWDSMEFYFGQYRPCGGISTYREAVAQYGYPLYLGSPDTAILRIEGPIITIDPQFQLIWAGWTTEDPVLDWYCTNQGYNCPDVFSYHYGSATDYMQFAIGKIFGEIDYDPTQGEMNCGTNCAFFETESDIGYLQQGSSGACFFWIKEGEPYCIGTETAGISCNYSVSKFKNFYYGAPDSIKQILDHGLPDDQYEENDKIDEAANITISCSSNEIEVDNLIVKNSDEDWYRIHIPPQCRLQIKTDFLNSYGDIDIYLFDENFVPITSSQSSFNNYEFIDFENTSNTETCVYLEVWSGDFYQEYDMKLIGKPINAQYSIGDVSGDNSVNIIDALFVARFAVGLPVSNFNADAADVNCDGQINIVDALFIARKAVGLSVNGWCGE